MESLISRVPLSFVYKHKLHAFVARVARILHLLLNKAFNDFWPARYTSEKNILQTTNNRCKNEFTPIIAI
jgi:hypothetical protein